MRSSGDCRWMALAPITPGTSFGPMATRLLTTTARVDAAGVIEQRAGLRDVAHNHADFVHVRGQHHARAFAALVDIQVSDRVDGNVVRVRFRLLAQVGAHARLVAAHAVQLAQGLQSFQHSASSHPSPIAAKHSVNILAQLCSVSQAADFYTRVHVLERQLDQACGDAALLQLQRARVRARPAEDDRGRKRDVGVLGRPGQHGEHAREDVAAAGHADLVVRRGAVGGGVRRGGVAHVHRDADVRGERDARSGGAIAALLPPGTVAQKTAVQCSTRRDQHLERVAHAGLRARGRPSSLQATAPFCSASGGRGAKVIVSPTLTSSRTDSGG